jgi:hypothetical protein
VWLKSVREVLILVFVKTGSQQLRCPAGIKDDLIIVEVHAPPVGGKANRESVSALAKFFGVSSSSVSIVKGIKDRNKVVRVLEVSVSSIKEKLGA